MNDPIDILEIASRRYAKALDRWQNVQELSAVFIMPPNAISCSVASLDAARADLWAARAMSHDLSLIGG